MITRRLTLLLALAAVTVLIGLLLTSCAAAGYLDSRDVAVDYDRSDMPYPEPGAEYTSDAAEQGMTGLEVKRIDNGVGESALRHVIRYGSIDLAVRDTRGTIREIREMITASGGIISNSSIYEMREGQYGAYITLRVPEIKFDAIMEQLETYGKATNVQTSLDDVTMQYVDLESRLKNQIAQEERLIEILEMATNVEEVLEVERELYRIRGDIESMSAQMTHLQDRISYATINLSLREETIPTESISPGAFDNFGKRLTQAFIGSVNFVLNALSLIIIAFIAILPVLLFLGIFVLLIVLLARKLAKRKVVPPDKKPAEPKKSK